MEESKKTLVVVPTYNEAHNIRRLVTLIRGAAPSATILIIDDNSPDGTGQIADQLSLDIPELEVQHRPGKLGLGTAHLLGLQYAIKAGYETAITIDADLTHDPKDIPRFLAALEANSTDIVVGTRYRGDSIRDWTWPRKIITRTAHLCTRLFLGLPFDSTGGFRAYRIPSLSKILFDDIRSDGYAFLFEMMFRCYRCGLKIREVPIVLSLRGGGESKISRIEILRACATLARLFIKRFHRSEARASQGSLRGPAL